MPPLPDLDVDFPLELSTMAALFAAIGALASVLANRGHSVFHDGVRPLIPDLRRGELERGEVSRTSFRLGLGFVTFFAFPFSIGLNVPVIHILFMATDWIGVSRPAEHALAWWRSSASVRGAATAAVLGAAWGVAVALAIRGIYELLDAAPVDLLSETRLMVAPVMDAFILFPVLTAAYFYGGNRGVQALAGATVAWFVARELGADSPAAWSFLAATVVLAAQFARSVRARRGAPATPADPFGDGMLDEPEDERQVFADNVARLKRTLPLSALLYGLMGAAFNLAILANDPIQGALYASGLVFPAVLVALAWGFAYLPMKYTTAATTGSMMTGTFYEAALAMLMPGPVAAFAALALLRVVEVYALMPVLRLLERRPELRELADTMRTATGHVMEVAFLIGGALAAASVAGGLGIALVIGGWWLNGRLRAPIMPLAIGPFMAILVGVVVNLFHLIGVGA
jgi:hypothetical protein